MAGLAVVLVVQEDPPEAARLGLLVGSIFLAATIGAVLAGRLWPHLGALGAPLVTGIVAAELGWIWSLSIPLAAGYEALHNREPTEHFYGSRARQVAGFLAEHPGTYRVDFDDRRLPRNLGQVLRVPSISGQGSTRPVQFQEFQNAVGWLPPGRGPDLLGVRYLFTEQPLDGVTVVGRADSTIIYENPRAFPLAWTVTAVQPVDDHDQALGVLADPAFDPSRTALVTASDLPLAAACLGPAASAPAIDRYDPDLIRYRVPPTASASLLVTSEQAYPGWNAYVDGEPARLFRVNYAFRAICVPPGSREAVMRYEPLSLWLGALLAMLGQLAILATVAFPRTPDLRRLMRRRSGPKTTLTVPAAR